MKTALRADEYDGDGDGSWVPARACRVGVGRLAPPRPSQCLTDARAAASVLRKTLLLSRLITNVLGLSSLFS